MEVEMAIALHQFNKFLGKYQVNTYYGKYPVNTLPM